MIEAIQLCESMTGKKMRYSYSETNRIGDHIWWISDVSKFKAHYPDWDWQYNLHAIIQQIYHGLSDRLK